MKTILVSGSTSFVCKNLANPLLEPRLTRFISACTHLGIREQLGRDWLSKKVFPIVNVKINGVRLISVHHLNLHLENEQYSNSNSSILNEIPLTYISFKSACKIIGVSEKLGRNWLANKVFPVATKKQVGRRLVNLKILHEYVDQLISDSISQSDRCLHDTQKYKAMRIARLDTQLANRLAL